MKRLISVILLIAVLLTCTACGKNEQAAATTAPATTDPAVETTLDAGSPEAMYGHIDQTQPVGGVYKIWNAEGVKNMANHPEGDFELLCEVDMGGAEITPLGTVSAPFTGYFNGANYTIKNFTLSGGADGAFGFIGVNQGAVENLYLTDVTLKPDSKCTNIGGMAGINEGTLKRSNIKGSGLDIAVVAENANIGSLVGKNSGDVQIVHAEIDLVYTANASANVGGIVGLTSGGDISYCKSLGILKATGGKATIGLYAGKAENTTFTGCVFLGAENSNDGKLFTNFAGQDANVTYPDCLLRDNDVEPLPENVLQLRDLVVQQMYEMGTIEWHVSQDLMHYCKCGTSGNCDGTYKVGWTYYGLPYKHGNGSLTSMKYFIGEDGNLKDFVYEMESRNGFDSYIGAMCSSSSQMGWWRVSNSVDHMICLYMLPDFPEYGCIPVGTGWYENAKPNDRYDTAYYVNSCTAQVFYEAMALARHGDCVVNGLEIGDHVRMVAEDPVVVRDVNGNIDGDESYVITHECSGKITDFETLEETNWRINWKYTFENLRGEGYMPVTIEELLTGEMEPGECTILDGADGKLGMTVGTVKGNYFMESVTLTITDSKGDLVLDKVMFPKAGKFNRGNTRVTSLAYIDYFDLAQFNVTLQDVMLVPGETYSYTISAHLACDQDFLLKTDSFTQGGQVS